MSFKPIDPAAEGYLIYSPIGQHRMELSDNLAKMRQRDCVIPIARRRGNLGTKI